MLFNSIEYLFFLTIVFFIYWSLHKRLKAQNVFLLIVSYVFYSFWDWRFLSLILISSITDYLIGQQLYRAENKKTRKILLLTSLIINLGLLGVFKYFNFFIGEFEALLGYLGISTTVSSLNIILPVGISFYTFQTLSYTLDIYYKKTEPTKDLIRFFAYVAFFPQLVAGPIERSRNLLPQFSKQRSFDFYKARDGMRQMLWGFFKKLVIADNCAIFADAIFNNSEQLSGGVLILGVVMFAIQIYGDFSGYSDIAIGSARILGFDLMQNFGCPYFSRNIAEFWRRWHISLTTWFRDYMYIPLGGSKVRKAIHLRNIFIIFIVSGFWHGANWTFIAWGLIHAILYIPLVYIKSTRKFLDTVAKDSILPNIKELAQVAITFSVVCFGWIFFRSESLQMSFTYIHNLIDFSSSSLPQSIERLSLNLIDLWKYTVFVLLMIIVEWINRKKMHGLQCLPRNVILRYGIYLMLSLLVIDYFYAKKSFIYFQF